MLIPDLLANLIIILGTALTLRWYFGVSVKGQPWAEQRKIFRFFTYLSNIFSGLTSLLTLVMELIGWGSGSFVFPTWLMLLRLLSTASVTVTFLTVLFFLAPHAGWQLLYKDDNLYMHVAGPLIAVASFVFLERGTAIPAGLTWLGGLTVILYAALYLKKVVFLGEERGGWPDFYYFNQGGRWKLSCTIMILAGLAISLVLAGGHNLICSGV